MRKSLIVAAHRGGAFIFESFGPKSEWKLRHHLDHPEGRLRDSEIDEDRPGSVVSDGGGMRAMPNEERATEHVAMRFAREIAALLRRERLDNGLERLILIAPPSDPANDCRMEMYNADGSRGGMCGNGIRCVARHVYERGIARSEELRIETDAGVKAVGLELDRDGSVRSVQVDMGPPRLLRRDVPLVDGEDPGSMAIDLPITVAGRDFRLTALSMGNPHAVVRVDAPHGPGIETLERLPIDEWGPLFERHEWFPERTNTEFIIVRSRREIDMRVWERGSGETLACGTGACAALVAASLAGWCDREARVRLRGGELEIAWEGDGLEGTVILRGPAEEVFEGRLLLSPS